MNLIANVSRAHHALEMRFSDKLPSGNSTHTSVVEHLKIDDRVSFWFRNSFSCRLCSSHPTSSPSSHFHTGAEARNHTTRECFLSYFIEEIRKGVYTGSSRWMTRLARKRDDSVIGDEIVRRIVTAHEREPQQQKVSPRALYQNYPDPLHLAARSQQELQRLQRDVRF
jgi:hypothetical protein